MITLQQLMTVAPFSEDVRKQLLEAEPTLSDAKRFELTSLCWNLIYQDYENRINGETSQLMYKVALGEKINTEEEAQKIEENAMQDLAKKLGIAADDAKLDEVRDELQKIRELKNTSPVEN